MICKAELPIAGPPAHRLEPPRHDSTEFLGGAISPSRTTLERVARGLRLPLSTLFITYELRGRDLTMELAGLIDSLEEERRDPFFELMWDICAVVSGKAPRPGLDVGALFDVPPKTMGEQIKRLRVVRGLSQDQLAELGGFSVDTQRRFEAGRGASFPVIEAAVKGLGLSLSAFFAGCETGAVQASALATDWIDRLDPAERVHVVRVLHQLRRLLSASTEPGR